MNNKYPLCNGKYRELVENILNNFTIDDFAAIVTHDTDKFTELVNEYHNRSRAVRVNKKRMNKKHNAFNCPAGIMMYDSNLNLLKINKIWAVGVCNYDILETIERVNAIRDYFYHILPRSMRGDVTKMLRVDKDFYGFMEYYLTGYDGMHRMIKRNINDYSRIHNAMQLLNDNISKRINYYYFHPAIYNTVSFMVTHMDITLPLIESVRLLQERGKLDINFQTAIEITREYHISKLPDMQRSVICDVVDSVNEEVWDNVVFDDATLDMITQIFYK